MYVTNQKCIPYFVVYLRINKMKNLGLILVSIYTCLIFIVALIWVETHTFYLPLITLILIATYEYIKRRNK